MWTASQPKHPTHDNNLSDLLSFHMNSININSIQISRRFWRCWPATTANLWFTLAGRGIIEKRGKWWLPWRWWRLTCFGGGCSWRGRSYRGRRCSGPVHRHGSAAMIKTGGWCNRKLRESLYTPLVQCYWGLMFSWQIEKDSEIGIWLLWWSWGWLIRCIAGRKDCSYISYPGTTGKVPLCIMKIKKIGFMGIEGAWRWINKCYRPLYPCSIEYCDRHFSGFWWSLRWESWWWLWSRKQLS